MDIDRRGFFFRAVGAVAAVPLLPRDNLGVTAEAKLDPDSYYILFYDAQVMDGEELARREHNPHFPANTSVELVPLKLHGDKSINDAVLLYKLEKP